MPRANNMKCTPSRWPTDLEYLHSMSYSPSVPQGVLEHLKGVGTSPPPVSNPSSVTIRHIDDMMHPAYGQMGLFASKKIMSHTLIIDYFGEVHADERTDSDYDLSLYRTQDCGVVVNVGIDAARKGNEARFINDYRGIRPKPNASFKERRTGEGAGELRISIWSEEVIKKGDEILVSYGKGWWKARLDR